MKNIASEESSAIKNLFDKHTVKKEIPEGLAKLNLMSFDEFTNASTELLGIILGMFNEVINEAVNEDDCQLGDIIAGMKLAENLIRKNFNNNKFKHTLLGGE